MAKINNISVYKGEDVLFTFTMSPVVNITGWQIVFTLRRAPTDSTVLATINAQITNGVGGVFTVAMDHAKTNIGAGVYAYDVQRTDPGSDKVLSIGTFTILQEVLY